MIAIPNPRNISGVAFTNTSAIPFAVPKIPQQIAFTAARGEAPDTRISTVNRRNTAPMRTSKNMEPPVSNFFT